MKFKQRTLVRNPNITFNIMSCLDFHERYYFCLTSIFFFNITFKEYKHNENIYIEPHQYLLSKKWENINFEMYLYGRHIYNVSRFIYIRLMILEL